jgi:hypothetical protein
MQVTHRNGDGGTSQRLRVLSRIPPSKSWNMVAPPFVSSKMPDLGCLWTRISATAPARTHSPFSRSYAGEAKLFTSTRKAFFEMDLWIRLTETTERTEEECQSSRASRLAPAPADGRYLYEQVRSLTYASTDGRGRTQANRRTHRQTCDRPTCSGAFDGSSVLDTCPTVARRGRLIKLRLVPPIRAERARRLGAGQAASVPLTVTAADFAW